MTTTELARELGQDLRELPAGTLAQLAFEASVNDDPDAAEIAAIAAAAYRKEQGITDLPAGSPPPQEGTTIMIDYARAKREAPALKAALTRARKSGDPAKVRAACTRAVAAWESWGAWPDNWATWQVALNDTEHWTQRTDLRDLL